MFISAAEKDEMRVMIQSLQASVRDAAREAQSMKQAIIDLECKVMSMRSPVAKPKRKQSKPTIRTAEAPWGYKLDGTPKKRPGRVLPVMNISISAEGAA